MKVSASKSLGNLIFGLFENRGWRRLQGHNGALPFLNSRFKILYDWRISVQNIMKICGLVIFDPRIPKIMIRNCENEQEIIYFAFNAFNISEQIFQKWNIRNIYGRRNIVLFCNEIKLYFQNPHSWNITKTLRYQFASLIFSIKIYPKCGKKYHF